MSRAVYWTAAILFGLGGGAFLYKSFVLDMALWPDRAARVWRVEMGVSVIGDGGQGRVEIQIPNSDARQALLDEHSFDDGLQFAVQRRDGDLRASWSGRFGDIHRLAYTFRVHIPVRAGGASPRKPARNGAEGTKQDSVPRTEAVKPAIAEALARLGIQEGDDPSAVVASLFGFVAHEIESVSGGSEDAQLVLRGREGSPIGICRLLIDLLWAAGIEARLGSGIPLHTSGRSELVHFVEARVRGSWLRLLPSSDSPGDFPSRFVVLSLADQPILSTAGVVASQIDFSVLREWLPPSELAAFVAPSSPFWRAISLYRLPVETQVTLQVLLVLPLAVLIAAAFRNLIGLRTFGIFMPILIALSLRRTDLASGLLLVTSVTLAGVVGRLLLDRLRLLFVPRVCLLLCLVILFVTALAQLGYEIGGRGLMSGLLFPIVILAILIERISVTALEEGIESTAKLLAGSLLLSAMSYPVFQSDWLAHLFFGFPELILCVMSVLVVLGGYTGYRVSELWRFRTFLRFQESPL